jgi:hypothetical protein
MVLEVGMVAEVGTMVVEEKTGFVYALNVAIQNLIVPACLAKLFYVRNVTYH